MAGRDLSQDQIRRMNAMLEELAAGGLLDGVSDEDKGDPQYVTELYTKQIVDPRSNQFVVEGDKGMLDGSTASSFANHYGGAPKQYSATEQERYNSSQPPGGDYNNWQWTGAYGWQYKGNAEDGTAGKSSFINDAGQRVHHDPVPSLERDQEWWDSKRALIGLEDAWSRGGDQFLREGGRYNEQTNPYVETAAMRQASQQSLMNSPAGGGVYDPKTNTTFFGGMHYQGDTTKGKELSSFSPEDQQYLTHDRYYTGMDQLTPEGYKYISDAVGRTGNGNPFIDTFDHDVDKALGYLGDKGYNPFYSNNGWIHQDMIDRNRELGRQGEGLTDYEKRKEGNIADYMYNAFSDSSMINQRGNALRNWAKWKEDNKINENSLYSRRMDQGTFNKLGLGDMGLTFDNSFGRPTNGANVASGGTNTAVNQGGSSATPQVKQGGFLDAYLKRQQEIKPSVMSLMQELEDS